MKKRMLVRSILASAWILLGLIPFGAYGVGPQLTEVYHNDDFQLTGISVSKTGRLFINFPRWSPV